MYLKLAFKAKKVVLSGFYIMPLQLFNPNLAMNVHHKPVLYIEEL